MSIILKSACRGKEYDGPDVGRDAVLVLVYEVQHWQSDTKQKRGTVLALDVVVRIDTNTSEVKTEVHITDCPSLADVPAAFAKLGEWCARLGEELLAATHALPHAVAPVALERKR